MSYCGDCAAKDAALERMRGVMREARDGLRAIFEEHGKTLLLGHVGLTAGKNALAKIESALSEGGVAAEPEPERWRCEGCGKEFDSERFSHGRSQDDGRGNPVEVECGPISKIGGGAKGGSE